LLRKVYELFVPFLTYDKWLSILTGIAVVGLMILLARRFAVHRGAAIALTVLVLAYVVAPGAAKGGAYLGTRLPFMMGLLLFAGFRPSFTPRVATLASAGLIALLVIRTASLALTWHAHARDLAALRQAISPVEAGARVLVVAADGLRDPFGDATEPAGRIIPNLSRTDRHMAALLLIERHAFWPLLFADPHQQPLAVRPPYDRIALPLGVPPDYRWLAHDDPVAAGVRAAPYLAGWRGKFDYVLLMDAGAVGNLAAFLPARLQLLTQSNVAALFRIKRRPH
jgi:hypothetical protein